MPRRAQVCGRLDHAHVDAERGTQQLLAVAGRACAGDPHARLCMRQVRGRLDLAIQPVERLAQRLDEVAADGFVDAVDDLRIGIERDELEGRRSRVDAEEQGTRRLVDALALELGLAMARAKRRELVGVLE